MPEPTLDLLRLLYLAGATAAALRLALDGAWLAAVACAALAGWMALIVAEPAATAALGAEPLALLRYVAFYAPSLLLFAAAAAGALLRRR